MSVPSLTVYQNGTNQVNGDQLNTFTQSATTVANLRTFVGVKGMEVNLQGFTAINDGGQGQFYWNSTSTATDDAGVTTVVPNGVTQGAWIRFGSGASTIVNKVTNSDGSLTISPNTGNVVASLGSYAANTALANATTGSAQPTGIALTVNTVLGRIGGNIQAVPFSSITTTSGIIGFQVLTSGTLYTPTVGTATSVIFGIAGGGGGAGAGTGSVGGNGGSTTFGTAGAILNLGGGSGGNYLSGGAGTGGNGGTATTGTVVLPGSSGTAGYIPPAGTTPAGGSGGAGIFGSGAGAGGNNSAGLVAGAHTGAGGGGAGGNTSSFNGNGGGGGGGIGIAYLTGVTGTYPFALGAGGSAGTGTNAGGAGAAGIIIVLEFA